ncbi:MAG: HEPN domain-containing protein [Chitinispirillaceae bacterium]|nr:HEPN domain-containing protein [Chitinispirillaceae bacterium]
MPDKPPKHYEILRQKADVDLAAVEHLIHAPDIDSELLLFHLQQAAEKYLKALLSHRNIHFEKTHDLIELLDLCAENDIILPDYANEFENLYPYAVQGRYEMTSSADVDPGLFLKKLQIFKTFIHKETNQ